MGNTESKQEPLAAADVVVVPAVPVAPSTPTTEKPKCKACCACPETKKVRDACIVEKGEENCTELIEAHKKCMREQGFNI